MTTTAARPAEVQIDGARPPLPQLAAELLRRLYVYLRDNAERHQELAAVIPVVQGGVEAYRAGAIRDAVTACSGAYLTIQGLRARHPDLPMP